MKQPWEEDTDADCMKDFIEVMHEQFSPEAFRKLYSNTPMDTSLDNIKLSRCQINDMQHCIKKGWFATSPSDSWQELVDMGLATVSRDPINRNDVVYRLTPKGRDCLAKAIYKV